MFVEMRVASIMHKYRLGATAMTAEQVLGMATNGGATAMGLGGTIGSLEEGKKADIIILDDGGLNAAPIDDFELADPVKRIVSSYQSASVRTSIIDGRMVMKDRELLTLDEQEVMVQARESWRRIRRGL
jgi:5-methylthioadenosine/S-adenosylhomocysteine deaminase